MYIKWKNIIADEENNQRSIKKKKNLGLKTKWKEIKGIQLEFSQFMRIGYELIVLHVY